MKQYMMYRCDYCEFTLTNFNEMEKHEANHFGLTVEEFHHWNTLKESVRSCSSTIYQTKNEETERLLDEAVAKLVAFEKEHNIKDGVITQ